MPFWPFVVSGRNPALVSPILKAGQPDTEDYGT